MTLLGKYKEIITLVFIYIIIYWGAVVSQVKSTEFMGVDPASIISSLNGLFNPPIYNMNLHYHSAVYGWTYFAINFLVLVPFKLLCADYPVITNTVIQGVLFLIGLGVVVAMYFLSLRVLSKKGLAVTVTLLFLLNPIAGHFFITVHPETTGVLFYLMGILFLIRSETKIRGKLVQYIFAVIFFSLSSLSKQPFFIVSFLVLVGFLGYNASMQGRGLFAYIMTTQFVGVLLLTVAISLTVAFIIHPYAFIEFDKFLHAQLRPLSHSSGRGAMDTVHPWLLQLYRNPIIVLNFCLILLIPIRRRVGLPPLFVYSVMASSFCAMLFMYMEKLFITALYLYPLLPVFFLNITYAFVQIYRLSKELSPRGVHFISSMIILAVCIPLFFLSALQTTFYVYKKLLLDGRTTKEASWKYISELPPESTVYYMPGVAMPPTYFKNSCHAWRECSTITGLQRHAPDYLFVIWSYKYFNPEPIKQYMEDNHYKMVDSIRPETSILNGCGELSAEADLMGNLNLVETIDRISDCWSQLNWICQVHSQNILVGDEISIYKNIALRINKQ